MAVSLHLDHNFKISANQKEFLRLLFPEAKFISHCLIMLHNKPYQNCVTYNI